MPPSPYHHGSLPTALLAAAEAILVRDGLAGLTLRAAARAAGVSHAAPKHHFGDLEGLLSELAAVGFRRFTADLTAAADDAGTDPRERMMALGRAYVRFAEASPGLFVLMFRSERLDRNRPALRDAMAAAFAALRDTSRPLYAAPQDDPLGEAIGSWSLVHGFAMLMIDGRLPRDRPLADLLEAVLRSRRRS